MKSEGVLGKPCVFELDKYQASHGLSKKGMKDDKVLRIMAHWLLTKDQVPQTRVAPNNEAKLETECHMEDEEKTISDDDSCYESDADDEVIVVMNGDDGETVSRVFPSGGGTGGSPHELYVPPHNSCVPPPSLLIMTKFF